MPEHWGDPLDPSRATTLCLTAITLPPSLARCCFDPARFPSDIYLLSQNVGIFKEYWWPVSHQNNLLWNISLQTMTHEIGHMFGIKHCQWLNCVMQGSNHLEESDRRPLDFCPICLRKTQSAVGFKIAERYKVQTAFHRRRNLNLKLYLLVFKVCFVMLSHTLAVPSSLVLDLLFWELLLLTTSSSKLAFAFVDILL